MDKEPCSPLQQPALPPRAPLLYVAIDADASFKIGTCEHCVLAERGRPARASYPDGDRALDFERDAYFRLLAHFGLVLQERTAYVCP